MFSQLFPLGYTSVFLCFGFMMYASMYINAAVIQSKEATRARGPLASNASLFIPRQNTQARLLQSFALVLRLALRLGRQHLAYDRYASGHTLHYPLRQAAP